MKTSVSYNQIVNELVNIFHSEARTNEYFNTTGGTLRDGVCGWCGVMAPLSKSAFIEDFGHATVEKAEAEARERLNANKNDYRKTNYFAHEAEATANEATNTVAAGSFVWACFSGLKNDGEGLRGFIHQCTHPEEEFKDLDRKHKRLVKIEKVFTVKSSELLTIDTDNLVATNKAADKNNYFPGGADNDDPDFIDLFDEYATYYTCAAAVVDELGRWFVIDSQGYDFARYIGAPINWREMFADIKAEEERKHAERLEAERLEAEREAAERLAVYNARCAKWESIMTDLRPLKKAAEEADKLHGWRSKEAKAADRKLKSGIRANVLAMVHAVYPGLRCSLRVNNGWGSAYELTYQDGPTLKEFNEKIDLDLFENIAYTFNGWDDSTGFAYPEFADFSEKYFTVQYGGINVDREQSDENRAQLEEIILKAVPEIDNIHPLTTKEYNAIANALGVDVDDIINKSEYWNKTAKGIAYGVFGLMSFAKANEATEATANEPTAAPTESNEDDKPADGLALVEIAGGVAVVGDARTTYRNRKEIKAHGGKWNKDAQQWQATEAEAVASLRRWFGVGNPEQPTPDDDPTPTKGNEESAAEATEATETTATDSNTTESEKSAHSEEKPQNAANNKNYPEWLKVGVSFCLIDFVTGKPTNVMYKCTAIDEINETFVISTDTHGSREYKLNSFYWSQFAPVEPTPTTAKEDPQSEEKAVNSTLYDNEKLTVSAETETAKGFEEKHPIYREVEKLQLSEDDVNTPLGVRSIRGTASKSGVSIYTINSRDFAPTWAAAFKDESEASAWIKRASKGVGALNLSAVDILKVAPDCIIYYSHRNNSYICDFIANHDGQTLYGCVQDYKNLLMYYRKRHHLKYVAKRIEEATEMGCNYVTRTTDDRASVEVRKEPENGLFVATWFVNGEIDETRTALTADGIAEMVLTFQQGYAWEPDGTKEETPYYSEHEKSPILEKCV